MSLPGGHKRCTLLQVMKAHCIGQNCSTVCVNEGCHRDAFLNEQHEVPGILRGLLNRLLSLEQGERRGLFLVILW